MISIDGITTGLDTTAIIKQLMSVERQPVTRLQSQQANDDSKIAAWKAISTALDKVRTTSAAISTRFGLSGSLATSSAPDAVSVSASAVAAPGTLRFRVTQLATAEQRISAGGIGDPSAAVGDGRIAIGVGLGGVGITELTPDADAIAGVFAVRVTAGENDTVELAVGPIGGDMERTTIDASATSASVGGLTFSFAAGSLTAGTARVVVGAADATTTVAQLASSLSGTGSPVSARVLTLGAGPSGDNRVVISAEDTGAASSLMVGTTGLNAGAVSAFTATSVVSAAKDAVIRIGTPGQDVAVQRATNTVTDVFDGVTLNLLQASADTEVAVQVNRDIAGLAGKVTAWVDAVNSALSAIDARSSYNPDTKSAGPLLSEAAARTLRQTLMSSITQATAPGTTRVMSQIGVSVDKDGRFTVDQTMLAKALTDDPAGVSALLSQQGTATDDGVTFDSATGKTKPGTYAVEITQAAAQAEAIGQDFGTLDADETVWVRVGSREVSYLAVAGSTADQVASGLRAAFADAGLAATADVVGGELRIRSNAYGSAAVLGVRSSVDGATSGSTGLGGSDPDTYTESTGVDVEGTIDGETAVGTGRSLTAISGDATGLRLRIAVDAPADLGTITYANGAAGTSNSLLGNEGFANELLTSSLTSAQQHRQRLQDSIEVHNDRLVLTEARYRKQFAQLEAMLSQLKSQGSTLTSLIAGLQANSRSNS
jgi:flagellar hook-associated protein 2